jgi:hypothetical protein
VKHADVFAWFTDGEEILSSDTTFHFSRFAWRHITFSKTSQSPLSEQNRHDLDYLSRLVIVNYE